MPSDPSMRSGQAERTTLTPATALAPCMAATAERRARYRAAVSIAAEQIAGWLDAHRARRGDAADAALASLGEFARGRIDGARFAALVGGPATMAPEHVAFAERAETVLHELLARGDAAFACDLPVGGDLRHAVHDALEEAGRAFGAALAFQAARTGAYDPEAHDACLDAFPFARWNRAERLIAPPLVVSLDGADLHADALAGFLDGQVKFVLVVRGPVTPAPLVRLVTPGTFVAQTTDEAELARAVAFDGPAVVAVVPETAARFVHDPAAGRTLADRLRVTWLPTDAPRAAVGGRSAAQQREELAQLATLADLAPPAAATAITTPRAADAPLPAAESVASPAADDDAAVGALAAWLLAQAGLPAGGAVRP